MSKEKNTLPLFLLPSVVLFPGMNLPLFIFEDKYKEMISSCMKNDKTFGVVFLRGNVCADIGTTAEIVDVEKTQDGNLNILSEGKKRFKIIDIVKEEPYYEAIVELYEDTDAKITTGINKSLTEIKKLSKNALSMFDMISNQELSKKIKLPEKPNDLLFLIAGNLTCSFESKQTILETQSIKDRTKKILSLLKEEIKRLEILLKNKETKPAVEKNGKLKI